MIGKRLAAMVAIQQERIRQMAVEGFTSDKDDLLGEGILREAARCYFEAVPDGDLVDVPPLTWPFDDEAWKPKDRRRNLVRAGAFIMADRDRLIRKADRGIYQQKPLPEGSLDLSPLQAILGVIVAELEALDELEARQLAGDVTLRTPDAEPDKEEGGQ